MTSTNLWPTPVLAMLVQQIMHGMIECVLHDMKDMSWRTHALLLI